MARIINLKEEYFEWMCSLVCDTRRKREKYERLLRYLHNTEFTYIIPLDSNRAADGIDLRLRFARELGYRETPASLDGWCSVLEMMVALTLRCEEQIMDDPDYGNRTAVWFWNMIENLGLDDMTDDMFNQDWVHDKILTFLNREYQADGRGGLFTIRRPLRCDLRRVEIWYQMCWYLDEFL